MAAGMPYSQSQWLALPPAKRGFKNYNRYLSWWNTNVRPKVAGRTTGKFGLPQNPLAPIDPNTLFNMATEQINAQINPVIDHYLKALDERGRTSMNRLRGATQEFIGSVRPMAGTIGAAYDTSIKGVQGVNQGIVDFLGKTGQSIAADARAGMEAINAPQATLDTQAGSLASLGTGVTGGALGRGSIEESRLYADRAADVTEAAQYPTFAAEYGFNAASDLERDLMAEREDTLGEFRSQIPGMVQSTFQTLLDRELQKAIAREGFDIDRMGASASGGASADPYKLYNTPTGTVRLDPNTGEVVPVPGTSPPSKPVKPQKMNETGLGMAQRAATDLHSRMMDRFSKVDPLTGPLTSQQRSSIVAANRKKAVNAVYGTLYSYYPGKSNEWYHQKAAAILRASNWPGAADAIVSGGIAPPTTAQARPKGKPTAAQPTPPRRNAAPAAPRVSPDASDRNAAARAAREKRQRQIKGTLDRVNAVADRIAATSAEDENKTEQRIVRELRKRFPNLSTQYIRQVARRAVRGG